MSLASFLQAVVFVTRDVGNNFPLSLSSPEFFLLLISRTLVIFEETDFLCSSDATAAVVPSLVSLSLTYLLCARFKDIWPSLVTPRVPPSLFVLYDVFRVKGVFFFSSKLECELKLNWPGNVDSN